MSRLFSIIQHSGTPELDSQDQSQVPGSGTKQLLCWKGQFQRLLSPQLGIQCWKGLGSDCGFICSYGFIPNIHCQVLLEHLPTEKSYAHSRGSSVGSLPSFPGWMGSYYCQAGSQENFSKLMKASKKTGTFFPSLRQLKSCS